MRGKYELIGTGTAEFTSPDRRIRYDALQDAGICGVRTGYESETVFRKRREVCDGEQAGVDGFPALSRGKERNMFEDKTMVADTLAGINGELMRFGEMIPQTENKELKTTLKQFRAACEQSQEELYQIAREKSYYVPAAEATQKEIEHVRNLFSKSSL